VADNFEKYQIEGLVFQYRPTSGMISGPDTSLGVVVMATQYDMSSPSFNSKQEMEAYMFSSSNAPYNEGIHPVECAPADRVLENLFVRQDDVPFGYDPRLYDYGRLTVATEGCPNNVIGELWATYDVIFSVPKLPSVTSGVAATDHFTCSDFPVPYNMWWDMVRDPSSTGNCTINQSGNAADLLIGGTGITQRYLVTFLWSTSSISFTGTPEISAGAGTALASILLGSTAGEERVSNSSGDGLVLAVVDVQPDGGLVEMSGTTTAMTGFLGGDLFVTRIPNSLQQTKKTMKDQLEELKALVMGGPRRQPPRAVRAPPMEPKLLPHDEEKRPDGIPAVRVPSHLSGTPFPLQSEARGVPAPPPSLRQWVKVEEKEDESSN